MAQDDLAYDLSNGTIIQDTYEILAPLGQGGMGSTYKARHIAMGHEVAVKVINANLTRDERALSLFKREANLMRELGQSDKLGAIIKIETLLQDKAGTYYLIMEFVEGQPLSYYTGKGARLMHEDLMKLADRLLDALAGIHARNIVHRDISPDNIMVPNENILEAKILDFGVASDTIGTEKSILGDTFAGKISYASPEQLGLFGGKVTPKSDLYSLGLVLLTAAGIKPPGKGSMADAIEARREDIVLADSALKPEARALIEGLLRADPETRGDIRDGGLPKPAPKAAAAPKTRQADPFEEKESGGSSKAMLAAAIALLAIIGGGAWVALAPGGGDETATAAQAPAPVTASAPTAPSPKVDTTPPQTMPKPTEPAPDIARIIPKIGEVAGKILAPNSPQTPDVESAPAPSTAPAPAARSGPNPFDAIMVLINLGTRADLQEAMTALQRIEGNAAAAGNDRARSAFMLARMHDPKFHNAKVSPTERPDATLALRYYQRARGYGAKGLEPDISRLGG